MIALQQSQLADLCIHRRQSFLSSICQTFGRCNINGMALISYSVNGPIVLALCAWPVDKVWQTFTRQVLNISTAISQSLSGTTDEDCKLVVETSQESVKVCQSKSHCFHFPCSVIPYTHQPGKTFSLTAFIVLFSDPLENLNQCEPWVFSYPSNTDSSNCCPSLGHSLSFQVAEKSYGLE